MAHYCSVVASEKVTHVDIVLGLLNLLLLLGGSSGGTGRSSSGNGGGSSSGCKAISLLETEAGSHGSACEVLEGVEHHVVDGSLIGNTSGEGDGSNVLGVLAESLKDGVMGDGENLGGVDLTVVEDVQDFHLVEERSDLELVKKGSLTGGDLLTFDNNLDGVDNLDLRLDNLGLDGKGLEERGLLGVHTGGASLDLDISGGEHADLGGGLSNLNVNDGLDACEVTVSENDTSVQDKGISDDVEVGAALTGLLISILHFLDGLLHEGVLSHDHDGADLSELLSHDTDLLGGDVIDVDEHALLVLVAALLGALPNLILALLLDGNFA